MPAINSVRVSSSHVLSTARVVVTCVVMFLPGYHVRSAVDQPFSLRLQVLVARVAFFRPIVTTV